ncbi:unnamed protein product [Adineta steineri]|uniref:Transglutaminase-like domain-containing protein n=1 Tax=Adineta steineri TaxID=433720 RepID=A0A818M8P0_9BILA|nr:unnamed protein product [Adineta steineri]
MGCCKSSIVHPVKISNKQEAEDGNSTIDNTTIVQPNTYSNNDTIIAQSNTYSDDDIIISKFLDVKDRINIQVADSQAFNISFIRQRQQALNNNSYRKTIESWKPNSLQELVQMIKSLSNGKSRIDQHWIIFYWVACNIEYDTVALFTKNYANQSAEGVFRTKKGVCAGYGNIYKYLCDQLQMPCERVSGYSKGYGFDDREGAPTEPDHAWNAVEIDGHWYLVESTWGAGKLNDNKAFERELDSYYFLPRPNEMIYHHLPKDEKWQLLERPIQMDEYMQMPKLRPLYFELNLELISPYNRAYVDLVSGKPYALVLIRAPSDVQLMADLKLNDKKIEGGHRVIFDRKKQIYRCYFAPASIGKHKITIFGKRNDSESSTYSSAIQLIMNIKTMPANPISYPRTWDKFFDLDLKIISPQNTHFIKLNNGCTHARILVRAPENVQLLGRLNDDKEQKVKSGNQVYWDRQKDIWQCYFAPDRDGLFEAFIMAKKKSDSGSYTSAVSFKIEAKQIPIPNISYPQTWQSFYDLGLKVIAPKDRANAVWNNGGSYAEIFMEAPDDVQLSCAIKYNDVKIKNGSLAQFNNEKKIWQLLFAPERTGQHELNVFGKRTSDTESSSTVVVKFNLDVTKIRRPMKFPTIYTQFETTKCQIYTPLEGILKKGSVVPIHCVIPNALEVSLKVDSEWITNEGYTNPVLQRQLNVGSKEITIYVKYQEGLSYTGLVKYTVE